MNPTRTDYEYYEWLVSQIGVPPNKSCYDLFERMHNVEFVWTVPNDDNRVQDGLDLRPEYLNGRKSQLTLTGVTFLEVLVGVSRRLAFVASGDSRQWAWRLIKNLKLNKMTDPLTESQKDRVDEILFSVIWRTYDPSGRGGLFPLKHAAEDQTRIEIWYQLNAYVNEMGIF